MMTLQILQSIRRRQVKDLTGSIWSSRWLRLLLTGASLFVYAALAAGQTPTVPTSAAPSDDGQWTMPAKNYAATRYSALDEINGTNVSNLHVAFAFSTGVDRGQEAAPIVANNTMFIVTPYPNIVFALDLTKPGAPIKWSYQPHPAAASQGVACCDVVNRGATYSDGKLFFNTLDDNAIALDAETGKVLWKTKLGDINTGETITMAPLVVKGKVLVGDSGGAAG
jgi:lanthanide-dependent methanol dehydrogenase